MKIAIIGAGIGGLTLALAFRQRGIQADVYEQASALTEIGAAVALSANATRELDRLGLMPGLEAVSTEPTELIFRDGRSGDRIAAHSVRDDNSYRARFGGPYFGVHRADLQKVLSGAVAGEQLHLGHRLASVTPEGAGVRLVFTNGRVEPSGGWPSLSRPWSATSGTAACERAPFSKAPGPLTTRCIYWTVRGLLAAISASRTSHMISPGSMRSTPLRQSAHRDVAATSAYRKQVGALKRPR